MHRLPWRQRHWISPGTGPDEKQMAVERRQLGGNHQVDYRRRPEAQTISKPHARHGRVSTHTRPGIRCRRVRLVFKSPIIERTNKRVPHVSILRPGIPQLLPCPIFAIFPVAKWEITDPGAPGLDPETGDSTTSSVPHLRDFSCREGGRSPMPVPQVSILRPGMRQSSKNKITPKAKTPETSRFPASHGCFIAHQIQHHPADPTMNLRVAAVPFRLPAKISA